MCPAQVPDRFPKEQDMRFKSLWLAFFLLCVPVTAQAEAAGDALLQSLYEKSGLEFQVQQIPATAQQAFDQRLESDQSASKMGHKMIDALRQSLHSIFVPAAMKRTIFKEFRERLSAEDVKQAIAWLDSPEGKKITALEKEASTPEKMQALPGFVQKLQKEPPAQSRIQILQRLDRSTKATEAATDISMATALAGIASIMAVSPARPDAKRPSLTELRSTFDAARPQMEAALRQQLLVHFLFTYRALTDAELARYLHFVETGAGRKYYAAGVAGLSKALLNSVMNLGTIFNEEFKTENL
jgi:hypothetical protein